MLCVCVCVCVCGVFAFKTVPTPAQYKEYEYCCTIPSNMRLLFVVVTHPTQQQDTGE